MKKLELEHAYDMRDVVAKYDQLLMDRDDSYQDRLRSMDEKVRTLSLDGFYIMFATFHFIIHMSNSYV